MLHADDPRIRPLLLQGGFGLERETLRITEDGYMAKTSNPFPEAQHIVRDFSENQLEINTPIAHSPEEVVEQLAYFDAVVQRRLAEQPQREYLWPFSNPPYILSENDVPIAQFQGASAVKTRYREYLSDRYGRYKMALSGIHFNYSFSDELLQADFAQTDVGQAVAHRSSETRETAFTAYKDQLYTDLAERAVAYGWIITAITAASPVMDTSYVEKRKVGHDLFLGLGTVRCSELGYWNYFTPVLDYTTPHAYAESIQRYIDNGLITYPSELYYPVRLKNRGTYGLEELGKGDISHIELRNIDLNPLQPTGIEVEDVRFCQLLLVWLASTPKQPFSEKDQVQAAQNFKNAAHYDLKTVKIVVPNGKVYSVAHAALNVIGFMEEFFSDYSPEVTACLAFQKAKFLNPENRYAYQVRRLYGEGYVKKGLKLAKANQDAACRR